MLIGVSGVGKTDRVITPLVARAGEANIVAVQIDVPAQPTDLERELLGDLGAALRDISETTLAEVVGSSPNLATGLRAVFRRGGLVVIDEFQRLLQPQSPAPIEPFADQFGKLARRPADGGALWLVSNRSVDPLWSEPFHIARLEPPDEVSDAVRIVVEAIGMGDARDRLPEARHEEVARRFGRNPRALRLLGNLLRDHDLDELIGPPQVVSEGLTDEELANDIERSLLTRARQGLSNAASALLRELTILPEPAPLGLIQAVGSHLGPVTPLLAEIAERFLLEQRRALRQVHPIVREVELPRFAGHEQAYRAAHLTAGQWYAARLAPPDSSADEAALARNLAGARHHLLAAAAPGDLRAALDTIRSWIDRRFHFTTRPPSSAPERDAQISLLELVLEGPGSPAAEFYLARLLQVRGGADDLIRARVHAGRATVGADFSDPWVLRLQLAYGLQGPQAVVALGPEAIQAVNPAKSLYAVYQVMAAALNHLGRDEEAIELCLEGAERARGNAARLVEGALACAAASGTDAALRRVQGWATARGGMQPQLALADVLLMERAGQWRGGAERAQIARRVHQNFLHLALHEAFCWLAAEAPEQAQAALDAFPRGIRSVGRAGSVWLAALVALRCGDTARARSLAEVYLEGPAPSSSDRIEKRLVWEWDTRVSTLGEANPALSFPILPPTLSGLPAAAIRPQHGPVVLPQHRSAAAAVKAISRTRVLAVATEWASGQGGLSTFNRQVCRALAAADVDVTCIAIDPGAAEIEQARDAGVTLIPAKRTPGVERREWLARRPDELHADYAPDFIIGHGRITGPAALRLNDVFPDAKRLHFVHMAPDEIEWHKADREIPAGISAETRTQDELKLGKSAHRVIAVGPRLFERYSRDLHPHGPPIRFDPGFDAQEEGASGPPPGAPWKVLLMGRMEDYPLKGVDLAARALGQVVEGRYGKGLPEIEFYVRGAKPQEVNDLRQKLIAWAVSPRLSIVVRAYTADEASLSDELRTSSLVLMPSRAEGFGLVGLEAIIMGTPTLVSSRSGLAQMLSDELKPEEAARVIVETTGGDGPGDDDDVEEWRRAIDRVLSDRDAAFGRAAALKADLGARRTWQRSIEEFLAALR
ncbi:glycosyltransferase [Phenylobacterium terrae]|uniref:Glycosyltransferase n=1 Tax=Phenylobacterium terrae TaxID=2665495 RepID=A0ABW4MY37_9CAUL